LEKEWKNVVRILIKEEAKLSQKALSTVNILFLILTLICCMNTSFFFKITKT